jgi:penicillin amidase/acyl-homoserine-lactone acylase
VTRLLINSHQPFTGPVAWYEARLKSEEGWDIVGGTFPGTPFIGHGHGKNLGWANTVNAPDLTDVYGLEINPENENQYLFDGEWKDLEVGEAALRVKLWGPFSWVFKREVLTSIYGPTIRLPHGTFAIRHAGRDEVRQAEQFYRLNKAQNFDEWLEAIKIRAVPSFNYVFADAQGNIAYLYNSLVPKRQEGYDWAGLLPGNTSDTLWTEFVPFEAMPFNVNPVSGFLINANNTPFRATDPLSDLRREDFPEWFGIEKNMTNRAYRALELLSPQPWISFDEFMNAKFDHRYSQDSEVAEMVTDFLAIDATGDADLAAIQEVLRNWDLSADKENTYAALPVLTADRVLSWTTPITDAPGKLEALKDVAAMLKDRFGRLDPQWGEVNRLRRGEVDLPLDGGPDTLRAIYGGSDLDEEGKITALAGDTLIYVVEWDDQGQMSSLSVHQFGSATLDEASPHYADQAVLFAEERFKPVLFDFEQLEPNVQRAYRPGE